MRPIERSDSRRLFELVEGNRGRLRLWFSWLDQTRSESDTTAFIEGAMAAYEKGEQLHSVILDDGVVVGLIGFHTLDRANRCGSIYYWVDEKAEGCGLVAAACREMIEIGFDRLALNRVEIRACSKNLRSCAVAERLGFTRVGTIEECQYLYDHFVDNVVYSILKSDWQQKKSPIEAPAPATTSVSPRAS